MAKRLRAPYPIVSADQAIAEGMTPKAIQSVAAFNDRMAGRRGYEHCANTARRLRALAREVDERTGYFDRFRGRRASNDNVARRRVA